MQNKPLIALLILLAYFGCGKTQNQTTKKIDDQQIENMLANLTNADLGDFKWLNKPKSFNLSDGKLTVVADKGTDFFNNPEDKSVTETAPILYKEVSDDFVAIAVIRPDFKSMWNAVALMVHMDENNWIKFAFENSDATGKSIVTVVTKNVSDDANGVVLNDQEEVWLKLVRKSNIYSMLWSLDGKNYKMARLTAMPAADTVKIGVEFQSPVGEPVTHELKYFNLEKRTVMDLRKGE